MRKNTDKTNVFTNMDTYILDHQYIVLQEIFIGKKKFIEFCDMKHMDVDDLIDGKIVDGWLLTII